MSTSDGWIIREKDQGQQRDQEGKRGGGEKEKRKKEDYATDQEWEIQWNDQGIDA